MRDTDAPSRSLTVVAPSEPAPLPASEHEAGRNGEGWLGRALRALFGWKAGSIRQDLEVVLEDGMPGDTGFSPQERTMLKNILGLRERRVEDVMVPRADIVAVQQDISLGELIKVFSGAGHSRLVVYNDTLDDPIGMAHIRDVIAYMAARAAVNPEAAATRKKPLPANLDLRAIDLSVALSATKIVRAALFVPPSMPAIDLLAKMQATRIHLALVIDEYGGTDGLVSIEDLVEEIVGDIEDEHDDEEELELVPQTDGSFVADARISLDDFKERTGIDLSFEEGIGEDVDTLGGVVVAALGRVPGRGEIVGHGGFEFEILEADPRRVKRLRLRVGQPAQAAAAR